MKNTNAVRTEIHYAQVGEYQLPLLTLPQTDDSEPLGKYSRTVSYTHLTLPTT